MPEMVTDEVDVFARVEYVDGRRMPKYVDVTKSFRKRRFDCILTEELLDSPLLHSSLAANEESWIAITTTLEMAPQKRQQVSKDRPLAR
jgi:hypothetical protein